MSQVNLTALLRVKCKPSTCHQHLYSFLTLWFLLPKLEKAGKKEEKTSQCIVPGTEICKEYLLRKQICLGRKFCQNYYANPKTVNTLI